MGNHPLSAKYCAEPLHTHTQAHGICLSMLETCWSGSSAQNTSPACLHWEQRPWGLVGCSAGWCGFMWYCEQLLIYSCSQHSRQHVMRAIKGKRGQPCWSACQKGEKVHVWWALERGDEALGEGSRIYLHLAFIMHGRENTVLMGRYWTAVNWSFLNWLRRRIGQRGFWEWGMLKLNPLWNAEDRRDWGIKQTQWWCL